jgi:hypothetical protein
MIVVVVLQVDLLREFKAEVCSGEKWLGKKQNGWEERNITESS